MPKKFLVIQLFLISILAIISQYQIPDLTDSSWSTALFLTPSGIITNYLNKDNSVLWSFYMDPSEGQINLSSMQLLGMLLTYLMMVNFAIQVVKYLMEILVRQDK